MRKITTDLADGSLVDHLKRLAVPASMGYFFNTMYNIVDTFWAGQLSTNALAALSLNFSLYMLAMSLGIGFAAAAGALVSNATGAKQETKSRKYMAQIFGLTTIFSLAAAVLLFFFLDKIFILLNSEGAVLSGALSYGRIIVFGAPFLNLTPVAAGGLSARGDTVSYRNALVAGCLLNIALDPLFMFTFGLGEAGVALATVIIQAMTVIFLINRLVKADGLEGMKIADYIPERAYFKEILGQAIPGTVNYLTVASGVFVITWFVSAFGRDAVAAYGAAVRVEQIALVPTSGLNIALAAMVGQNNGAGRMDRVKESFRLSLIGGAIVMGVILPPVLIFGRRLLGVFTETEPVVRMGYEYLLLQGITYYSYIILFQSNSLLQGLKKPAMIMWMGLYRQIAAPAGVFYLLSFALGMEERGVWVGLIFINWSAAVLTLLWAVHIYRQACRS